MKKTARSLFDELIKTIEESTSLKKQRGNYAERGKPEPKSEGDPQTRSVRISDVVEVEHGYTYGMSKPIEETLSTGQHGLAWVINEQVEAAADTREANRKEKYKPPVITQFVNV